MKKSQNGFTVLEVVVTIAIAGFILVSVIAMINSLNVINDRARDLTLANALAENKVEGLRSIGFSGLVDETVDFTDELPNVLAAPRQAQYVVSSPSAGLKQVEVEITYNDYGSQRNIEYRTYIGELGVGQY